MTEKYHTTTTILEHLPSVKPNGRCYYCNHQLVINKTDHNFIRTDGYEKDYGDKCVIRCPMCGREQLRHRSKQF